MRIRVLALAALAVAGCDGSGACVSPTAGGAEPYEKLSDYCLFKIEGGKLKLDPQLIPYELNSPLFSDYARKFRSILLPKGAQASYSADGVFGFPVGTVVVKTFAFPADMRRPEEEVRFIETRLLVKQKQEWVGLPYIWNAAQTEAVYSPAGELRKISFADNDGTMREANYLVPNKTQCKQCHVPDGTFGLIGPSAAQLNRDFSYDTGVQNQLADWTRRGVLAGAPAATDAPRLAAWDDPATGSTAERARAWLEANCAFCHNPKGLGRTSGLSLGVGETDPASYGVCKTPVAAGQGAGGRMYDILPGDPDQSILIYRVESTDPGVMMPQLGRSLVHWEGVKLVREWIAGMPGDCH